jgi:hypothetical protein
METIKTRLLGTIDEDTLEAREGIKKKLKAASAGILPAVVLETMKQYGWRVLGQDSSDEEKEKAKLVIAYAWWVRELESGTSKNQFEKFMQERLDDLDQRAPAKYKTQAD